MKIKYKIFVFLIVLAFIFVIAGSSLTIQKFAVIVSRDFAEPIGARMECSKDEYPTNDKDSFKIRENTVKIWCPGYTQECEIYIGVDDIPYAYGGHIEYYICPFDVDKENEKGCSQQLQRSINDYSEVSIGTITKDNSIFVRVEADITNKNVNANVRVKYHQWQLVDYCGGAKNIINSKNCDRPYSVSLGNFLKEDSPPASFTFEGANKWRNYVCNWVKGFGVNVYTHSQYGEVYCYNNVLYDIVELELANGKLQKINPTYKGKKSDGTIISGMGKKLEGGVVECCPYMPECGDDFKFHRGEKQKCFTDAQCEFSSVPAIVANKQGRYQTCENGYCEYGEIKTFECTSNHDCVDGKVCDLSTYNFGNCIIPTRPSYCGNGVCDKDESAKDCSIDCGQVITKKSYTGIILIILGIVIIGLLIYLVKKKKIEKPRKKKRRS